MKVVTGFCLTLIIILTVVVDQLRLRISRLEANINFHTGQIATQREQLSAQNKAGMLQAQGGIALAQEIEALRLDIQRLQRKTLLPEQPSELKSTYQ